MYFSRPKSKRFPVVGSLTNLCHVPSAANFRATDAGIAPYPASCPGFSANPNKVGRSTATLIVIGRR